MADTNPKVTLALEIEGGREGDEARDRMTRSLARELEQLGAKATLPTGAAPQGSKGDAVTLGTIGLSLLSGLVPHVIDYLKNWLETRQPGHTITLSTVRGDQRIKLKLQTGLAVNPETKQALLTVLGDIGQQTPS